MVRVQGRVFLVVVCAFFAAPALAQQQPTEAQLQSARDRLREAMGEIAFPPATYSEDPFPDYAVPDGAPYVLQHPAPLAPQSSVARAAEPAAPAESPPAAIQSPPPAPAATESVPPAKKAEPPRKNPAVAKESAPPLQSGRAAASEARKSPAAKPKPAAPRITLPGALRP